LKKLNTKTIKGRIKMKTWKKLAVITIVFTIIVMAGCDTGGNGLIPATDLTLNKITLTFSTGDVETLTADVTPSNSTDNVTWTSSNTSVATVDNNGKITAVGFGTATITAKAGNITKTCDVISNGYSFFDGTNTKIVGIRFAAYDDESDQGGIGFGFWKTDDRENYTDFIAVQFPNEYFGNIKDLSEEYNYQWGFWAEIIINFPELETIEYWQPDLDMTGTAHAVREGITNRFTIKIDATQQENELKLFFSGEFEIDEDNIIFGYMND